MDESRQKRKVSEWVEDLKRMNSWVIGVDLGGQSIRAAWVSSEGEMFGALKTQTKAEAESSEAFGRIHSLVQELLDQPPELGMKPLGIGFGIPGLIDLGSGRLWESPHFPAWKNLNLTEILKAKFSEPVFVDNDANVAALGEKLFGSCHPFENFLYCTLGTGIGGALFLNGDLYRGSSGLAGEIGHTTVDPLGPSEVTGNSGSVELYASASGLNRALAELRTTDPSLNAFSIRDLYQKYKKNQSLQSQQSIKKIFDRMGEALGIVFANTVNLLDLEAICVAGGLTHAWEAFGPTALRVMRERSFVARLNRVKLFCTSLNRNESFIEAGVIGAASLAFLGSLRRAQGFQVDSGLQGPSLSS
ncbi:MAG: ROK family protein [Bradymonadales bacterium]|nr:MAG: ROK family protein [Bradymonadales bacterium]